MLLCLNSTIELNLLFVTTLLQQTIMGMPIRTDKLQSKSFFPTLYDNLGNLTLTDEDKLLF